MIHNELDVLAELVPLGNGLKIIELGCGSARLLTELLERCPGCEALALEVDAVQHAKNLARLPESLKPRLRFMQESATAIPSEAGQFDLALMLKSLHHIPLDAMQTALAETWRVLRPGGWLYVSEPVYAGALNDIVKLYNDEGPARAAAQAALDQALLTGQWQQTAERRFDMPAHFADWESFEQRMLYPSFADHQITDDLRLRVKAAFDPYCGADGASFTRPIHVRLLQKQAV
ncbi:MAG: methyltransferase domain-containing protein [Thiomonas sp.]|uniref:class I SAM-dependent methyltransferase n=1 Tax=Thiomonas sp. TaxID=2047785 RepID=UPI002A366F49|nr:methyltransferase domain-containing protein [Thiomonas sp.]MDY0331191.1 methyltransferase domain-containing protein [Thiomonas sp.]